MTVLRPATLLRVVALGLTIVLALAGVGRGFAAASDMPSPGFGISGVAFPICHTGEGGGSAPVDPSRHDCCDACALLAPLLAAEAPVLSAPASVMRYVEHVQAMAWVPAAARPRSPRQSQGPPVA